jgi:hypothetical protein
MEIIFKIIIKSLINLKYYKHKKIKSNPCKVNSKNYKAVLIKIIPEICKFLNKNMLRYKTMLKKHYKK